MTAPTLQIIDSNTMIGIHPAHKLDISPERLIRDMDRHRIAASLTLSTIGVFHDHITGNEATLQAAKTNNRLVPVATITPIKYFGEDLSALRSQGFRIVRLFGDGDSPALKAILNHLIPLRMPVLLDQLTHHSSLIAEYPPPIILCGVTNDSFSDALAVMAEHANVMLETHCLTALGALEMIVGKLGADRIVFGSGAPIFSVSASLSYVLTAELPDDDKAKILGGNIRRILEAA